MAEHDSARLLLCADRLFDALSTRTRPAHAVLVVGPRVAAVGPAAALRGQAGPGTQVIDYGDACIAPGLIDAHTHVSLAADGRSYAQLFAEPNELMVLAGVRNLRRHLAAGITTIRDNGARDQVGFVLKEGLRRGYIAGPRLLASGRSITCTEGHFHMCNEVADGVDQMRRAVRRLVHQGADFIKVMASGGGTAGTLPARAAYSVEELRAAVEEAHGMGRLTAAHCRATESMARAVQAGVDLLEHAEFLALDGQLRYDAQLAATLRERGTFASPTLQAWTGYPQVATLAALQAHGTLSAEQQRTLAEWERRAEPRLDLVRRMLDGGLKELIVPGTDCGVGNLAFGGMEGELELLCRVGFTPAEALLAATRQSARAIGMADQIGTVEAGRIADLAVFRGDPTADLRALRQVVAVVQGGAIVRASEQ